MNFLVRESQLSDVDGVFNVRTSVNENLLTVSELEDMGITKESIKAMIENSTCCWVAIQHDEIVGFSMISPEEPCVFALFVLPAAEGQGVGKALLQVAENELFNKYNAIWLETGRSTRAAEFYQHQGWIIDKESNGEYFRLIKSVDR